MVKAQAQMDSHANFINSSGITLDGVLYANTLDGACNTLEFLNFFDKAAKATQVNGNPVFMAGDILIFTELSKK